MPQFYSKALSIKVNINDWTREFHVGEKSLNENRVIEHRGTPGKHNLKFDVPFNGLTYPIELTLDTRIEPSNGKLVLTHVPHMDVKGADSFKHSTDEVKLSDLQVTLFEMEEHTPGCSVHNFGQRGPLPHIRRGITETI